MAGDLDDPESRLARLVAGEPVQVRKPEQGTRPKVFYLGADTGVLTPALQQPAPHFLWAERPPADLAKAMAERGVIIGRSWPVWPTYVRISVGTPDEMKAFCRALDTVA